MGKITLKVIGRVRNSIQEMKRNGWEGLVSEIMIQPEYEEALEGLAGYSHLYILFWLNQLPKPPAKMKKVHPKARLDLPLVGIFATRTQYRPNPIGLTLVELLGLKKNILKVRGLDALDGTPVIDIKPISPRYEFPKKFKVPKWYGKLWKKTEIAVGNLAQDS